MKYSRLIAISLLAVVFVFVVMGCGRKTPTALNSMARTSTVLMKASPRPVAVGTDAVLSNVPVPGGSLDIVTALVNIDQVRIEENSGFDVEQQGDHNDGEQGGPDNEMGGPDNEQGGLEADQDIIVTGPFALDISNGDAVIQSVDVYPGTFKKVDLTFSINTAPPFNGKTIVINGTFVPDSGTPVSMALKSEFAQEIQTPIAGGGITVADNSTVAVTVAFDLAGWFDKVDLTTAQVANGEIIIDNAHNTALLAAFEANLGKYVDVEEDATNP